MIHRLNEQVLDSPDSAAIPRERKPSSSNNGSVQIPCRPDRLSPATSTLRNLVEENAKQPNPTQLPADSTKAGSVSEEANNGEDGDDDDSDIDAGGAASNRPAKRTKIQ